MTLSEENQSNSESLNATDPDLQVPYGQFTFNVEGNDCEDPNDSSCDHSYFSRKAHLPPNSKSGVTIGKGYDVGSRKPYQVLLHLMSAGVDRVFIKEMMKAAGKKGSYEPNPDPDKPSEAWYYWQEHKETLQSFTITRKQQKKLFEIVYADYEANVIRWLYTQRSMTRPYLGAMICWKKLDPRIQIILIDFKFRGEFFGKETTRYAKYNKLKEAIRINGSLTATEEQRETAFEAFKNELNDRDLWENVPIDRFNERNRFLRDLNSQNAKRVLKENWDFTYEAEFRKDLKDAHVPVDFEDRSGIVMGRGFNLRTRHCYKARLLYFRSHSFPKARAREEIVRPDFEVKKAFEAIGMEEAVPNILQGKAKIGKSARNFLAETPRVFPTLNDEKQKALFDLTIPCYESDVILSANNHLILKALNGHSKLTNEQVLNLDLQNLELEYKCISWARVDPKIKDVLIDLSFTGDWHNLSRKLLLKHVLNNDVQGFKDALGDPENWKPSKFNWSSTRGSRVALPPTQDMLDTRFDKRRRYLAPEFLGPIEQDEGQQGSNRSLIKLVPCAICKPLVQYQTSSKLEALVESSGPDPILDIGATARIIPELIQLNWTYKKSWKESGRTENIPSSPEPDDPLDPDEEPNFPDNEPYDPEGGTSIGSAFVPIENINCEVLPRRGSERTTKEVKLDFTEPSSFEQIDQSFIIRFTLKGGAYLYRFINQLDTNSPLPLAILNETINFNELESTSVDFDHHRDIEGAPISFGHLVGDDYEFQDLLFPLPNTYCKMLPENAGTEKTNRVRFEGLPDIGEIAKGFGVRYRLENEAFPRYTQIEDIQNDVVSLSNEIEFENLSSDLIQFDVPFFMPLNKMGLGALLGEALPAVDTVIGNARESLSNNVEEIKKYVRVERENGKVSRISVPITLKICIPSKKQDGSSHYQPLTLYCNLRFEKRNGQWQLKKENLGRFYLQFPFKEEEQIIEFGIFSLVIPRRPVPQKKPISEAPISESECDVYFDLSKREFGFTFKSLPGDQTVANKNKNSLQLYFPGGLSEEKNKKEAKNKRFLLELEKFDPDNLEEPDEEKEVYFRLNSEGLSIKAAVVNEEVSVVQKEGHLKALSFKPIKKAKGKLSQLVIINNTIKEASFFAKMLLPGCKNLEALVSATLKQEKPGKLPIVEAALELENNDSSALAELDLKMLQMQIDSIDLKLRWASSKWDFDAYVDGKLSLTAGAELLEDLKDLQDQAAIGFKRLNLKQLNLPNIALDLDLEKPVKMEILDGLFGCSVTDLNLDWNFDSSMNTLGGTFHCKETTFKFNKSGSLSVDIEAAELDVVFDGGRFNIDLPNTIGVKVKVGESVEFVGSLGWIEKERKNQDDKYVDRYFFAKGQVKIEGLDIKALLKFGSLTKEGGEQATNFVLYAETDFEAELFPGIVLKKIGGGVAINNKLEILGENPNETEIIDQISKKDNFDPGKLSSWKEVYSDGIYMSIIASAMIASNRGTDRTFNAYIMHVVISLDSNFDLIAAGKLWLASSMGYLEEKEDRKTRPALIGAMVLSPRQARLGIELRSQKNPAIESSKLLSQVLDKVTTHLAFKLSPQIVDYHLKEISFKDNVLGARVEISGHYRFAIFRRALLVKAGISMLGHYSKSFRCAVGGFSCKGDLFFLAEYGGLFSAKGINLFARIQAGLSFEASAFIDIVFRVSFKVFGRRVSWSFTIRFGVSLPSVHVRFRGGLAISEKGRIGFEGYAAIGISICGYRLEMEPRISFNPEVIKEVRDRVAAFERLLDGAFKNPESIKMNEISGFMALSNFVEESSMILEHKQTQEFTPDPEKWLHYSSFQEADEVNQKIRHCYMPSSKSQWMTPLRHSDEDTFKQDVKKILVGKLISDFSVKEIGVIEESSGEIQSLRFVLFEKQEHLKVGMPLVFIADLPEIRGLWYLKRIEGDTHLLATCLPHQELPQEISILRLIDLEDVEEPSLFVPKKVLFTPWDKKNRAIFFPDHEPTDEEKNKEEQLRSIFFESTLDEDAAAGELPTARIEVIYDPRFESESREFMPLEKQQLPEDVWSAQFNEIPQEIDPSETGRDELLMIAKYEHMQKIAAHKKQHLVTDVSDEQRQKQAISQIIKLILDDLNASEPEYFESEAIENHGGVSLILGLVYEEAHSASLSSIDDIEEEELHLVYEDGPIKKPRVRSPDREGRTSGSLRSKIKPLKVRQDFMVTQANSSLGEQGRLHLSLPIQYDLSLFERGEYDQIGVCEIYRNEEKVPVSRSCQPNFWTYRHEKEVTRGTIEVESGSSFVDLKRLSNQLIEEASEHYYILLQLEQKKGGTKYRQIVCEYNSDKQILEADISGLSGVFSYVVRLVHKTTQLVVEPCIFHDEIPTLDRRLEFSQNSVEYSLRIHSNGRHRVDPVEFRWGRENLFIPQKEILPDDLSIAFPVQSLVKDNNQVKQDHCFIFKGAERQLWTEMEDQFEIWVLETPMKKTGFYIGESPSVEPNQDSVPQLKKLSNQPKYESSDGKQKVDLVRRQKGYEISSLGLFRYDCSYQFFIRKREDRSKKLFPMQHLILKDFNLESKEKVKAKVVEHIEWIKKLDYNNVVNRNWNKMNSQLFSTNNEYVEGQGNYIDTRFEQTDLNMGGVELFYIDQDEPGYIRRQQCEVLDEKAFESEQKSFNIESNWKSPRWQIQALKNRNLKSPVLEKKPKTTSVVSYYFSKNSSLIRKLINSIKALKSYLTLVSETPDSYDWKTGLYIKALEFLRAIARFENSPLNIHYPAQVTLLENIRKHLSLLLLGGGENETVAEVLKKVTDAEIAMGENDDEIRKESERYSIYAFDLEYTRRFMGMIQRRLAIMQDLFDFTPVEELPDAEGADQVDASNTLLPSQQRWNLLTEEYENVLKRLEQGTPSQYHVYFKKYQKVNLFKGVFKVENLRFHQLKLIELLGCLRSQLSILNSEEGSYLHSLSRVVPTGRVLAQVLDRLSLENALYKRMHHTLIVDDTLEKEEEEEDKKVKIPKPFTPKPTHIKPFLPDLFSVVAHQQSTAVNKSSGVDPKILYSSSDRLFLHFFNLLEYLGFAIDITLANDLNQTMTQQNIIDALQNAFGAKSIANHRLVALRPVAPNMLRENSEFQGYSFIKVALIPEVFFEPKKMQKDLTIDSSEGQSLVLNVAPFDLDTSFYALQLKNREEGAESSKLILIKEIERLAEDKVRLHLDISSLELDLLQNYRVDILKYDTLSLQNFLAHRDVSLAVEEDFSEQAVELCKLYFSLMIMELDRLSHQSEEEQILELFIETASQRWMTLPSFAGFSHANWKLPDQLGHRTLVAIRNISRYEPLIHWEINRYLPYEPPVLKDLLPFAKLVRSLPVEYGYKRRSQEQMLLSYNYPHPSKAVFSYQLPPDAARSVRSQIASIRTGYKGNDLVFYHELINHKKRPIETILNKMSYNKEVLNDRFEEYDSEIIRQVVEPNIRLFDHERLVTLRHLPYFYKYFFNVRALYQSHLLPRGGQVDPNKIFTSTQVEPTNLYTFEPKIVFKGQRDFIDYEITLPISRHIDHLTGRELAKEPYPLTPMSLEREELEGLTARDIPDLHSVYNIYWKLKTSSNSEEGYHTPVVSLHMPWSEEHKPKQGHTDEIYMPRLKDINDKFSLISVGSSRDSVPEDHQKEYKVPLEYNVLKEVKEEILNQSEKEQEYFEKEQKHFMGLIPSDIEDYCPPNRYFVYQVSFVIRIKKKDSIAIEAFDDPEQFVLQINRKGALASSVNFTPISSEKLAMR